MDFCSKLKFTPNNTLPLISPRSDTLEGQSPRREATFAGRILNPHLRMYKRSPTTVWDFRTLYESRQTELMPMPDDGLPTLGDRLNRLPVWREMGHVKVREVHYLPDIQLIKEESQRYQKQHGRRAYERMFAGGNDVILGTPDDLISPSPWQPRHVPSQSPGEWEQITVESGQSAGSDRTSGFGTRPPSSIQSACDANLHATINDDDQLTNVTKRTFSGSSLPTISNAKVARQKVKSVSKVQRDWQEQFPGLRLRPMLIKNARHRAICNPGGKKWKHTVKPISYKNFVLPSVSMDATHRAVAARLKLKENENQAHETESIEGQSKGKEELGGEEDANNSGSPKDELLELPMISPGESPRQD